MSPCGVVQSRAEQADPRFRAEHLVRGVTDKLYLVGGETYERKIAGKLDTGADYTPGSRPQP
jgi:hypothetical protein